jgi:hypothetical protein
MSLAGVQALLDTGSDITLLPSWAVEQLGLRSKTDPAIKLIGFDGSARPAEMVELEASFLGGRFQGRYAITDQPHGIVGRNLINHFRLLFDGPSKTWQRIIAG